jgi:hypothetical protein
MLHTSTFDPYFFPLWFPDFLHSMSRHPSNVRDCKRIEKGRLNSVLLVYGKSASLFWKSCPSSSRGPFLSWKENLVFAASYVFGLLPCTFMERNHVVGSFSILSKRPCDPRDKTCASSGVSLIIRTKCVFGLPNLHALISWFFLSVLRI